MGFQVGPHRLSMMLRPIAIAASLTGIEPSASA
jgi:hypothetical protein